MSQTIQLYVGDVLRNAPDVGEVVRWWVRHPWLIVLSLIIPFMLAFALSHLLGSAFVDLFKRSTGSVLGATIKWGAVAIIVIFGSVVVLWCLAIWLLVAFVAKSERDEALHQDID